MAYLFTHFTGESENGEQIYFSVSIDGLHWNDLGKGPALISDVGENGVRDPFVVRNCLDDYFYILATDLRIANGKGWEIAQMAGSTGMVVWRSKDLLKWERPILVDLPYVQEVHGSCVWAPEAYFDKTKKSYMVYWASMVEKKQRIFAAWTKDFYHYENYTQLIEKKQHIIDTTYAEEEGLFYRISAGGDYPGISMEMGTSLTGDDFKSLYEGCLPGMRHMEGPIIQLLDGQEMVDKQSKWCLYADDIGNGSGYVPFFANRLSGGNFVRARQEEFDMGERCKRHGSILSISELEYVHMIEFYGLA